MKDKTNTIYKMFASIFIFAVIFGVNSSVFASTYNAGSHTITADGTGFDGTNGTAFVNDTHTEIIILGPIDSIRNTLISLHDYLEDTNNNQDARDALTSKLEDITKMTLEISQDTTIIPDDLGYITFLTNYIGNNSNPIIDVNVSGKVNFDKGQTGGLYENSSIADVVTDKFTLKATGIIELPDNSDINTFFGSAKVEDNNTIKANGITYKTNSSGFEIQSIEDASKADIELSGDVNKNYKLSLTGSVTDDLTLTFNNSGSVADLNGITSISITTYDGDLSKVKLWNKSWEETNSGTYLSDTQLLSNGIYLGDSHSFRIGNYSSNDFRLEFTATGTYTYNISILSADNQNIELTNSLSGTIVVSSPTPLTIFGSDLTQTLTLDALNSVTGSISVSVTDTGSYSLDELFTLIEFDKAGVKLYNNDYPNVDLLNGGNSYNGVTAGHNGGVSLNGNFSLVFSQSGSYTFTGKVIDKFENVVSNVLTGSILINDYSITPPVIPPEEPSYSGGGGVVNLNGPKLATNSGTSIAESNDKSKRIEVSYPAWIRTLTSTYNQSFDDASIMPDGTYRYMYHTLTGYIKEIPFSNSVGVKITDSKLNKDSKIYIRNSEDQEWRELTSYELEGNTITFGSDKGFIVRIINAGEEELLSTPVKPTESEIKNEAEATDLTNNPSGKTITNYDVNSNVPYKIPELYVVETYYVNRKIIPGNGEEHFAEVNAFLGDLQNLPTEKKVDFLSAYLPELKAKIENEVDEVQKERLKILYVLSGKVYNINYKRLKNTLEGKF